MKETNEFLMKPKIDFCFKELMTDPKVRKGFLSAILNIPPKDIKDTVLLPTHLRKTYENDKLGILDVRILLNNHTQVDMEIQILSFKMWPERSLFYLCRMYADQIDAGEEYETLEKCIHVGILDFLLFPGEEAFYSRFHLWEDIRHQLYTDKLEIHILELPKLAKFHYPETELLSWAKFINTNRKEELKKMAEKNEYIGKAYEKLLNISADNLKRQEYEEREKALRDHNYLVNSNLAEGRKEGRKEGFFNAVRIIIQDYLEEGKSEEEILYKLNTRFQMERGEAIELLNNIKKEEKICE